jgi:2',3'-cyclic-nucleotide 2'-phosphodiesterase (5'-nucleotidase family)
MLLNRPPDFFAIPSGALRLTRIEPSASAKDVERFLLVGDATAAPIVRLIPDQGEALPAKRVDLDYPVRLKIVHFNDLHGNLVHFASDGCHPVFSRMARYIETLRRRYQDHPQRGVLAFSSGDDAVGSVFDALLGQDAASYRAHASYRLYSAAGIDACTMGNHDLDLGVRRLAHALQTDASFPLLTANLAGCSWLSGLYFPAAIFVVKGVRVAVIGLTTPAQIAPQPDSTLHFIDPIQVMHNLLPAVQQISDVVIVLSHLGYSLSATSASVHLAGDRELAAALPPGAVQVIIGGHTHHALNEQGLSPHNIVNGIPIVQAGKQGEFLGEVDITVGQRWAAVTNVHLLSTARLADDDAFQQRYVQPLLAEMQPFFEEPLGVVADEPDLSIDVVRNELAAHESALGNFITDALVARCRAAGDAVDFAVIDASCIAAGLPPGRLTFGDWFAVTPYADTIQLCRITGRELQHLFADNARRLDRPDEAHTERGFLHFSREVRYRIVLGASRRDAQAVDITINGLPLDELTAQTFTVACTSFMHMLSAAWERTAADPLFNAHALPKQDTYRFVRDELLAYIHACGGVTAQSGARRDGRLVVEE